MQVSGVPLGLRQTGQAGQTLPWLGPDMRLPHLVRAIPRSLVHKSMHTTVSCFDGCCIGQLSESARRRDVQDRSSAAPQAAIRAFGQPSPDLSVRRSRVTGVDDSDETGRSRPVRRREDQDQQMWPTRRTRPAPSPRSAEPSPRFPECRGPPDPSWVGYHSGLLGVLRCR
jgi:hypothetical protein